MFADQRHKRAGTEILRLNAGFGFDRSDEVLIFRIGTDRNDQPAAHTELIDQRLRDIGAAGRNQNSVIRR